MVIQEKSNKKMQEAAIQASDYPSSVFKHSLVEVMYNTDPQ